MLAVVALLSAGLARQYVASRYAHSGAEELVHSPGRAVATLRQAARLDPFSLSTLYSLAAAYARLDDYTRARTALLLAARREPSNYVPHALLGDLSLRRGQPAVARAEYRRALALNPRDLQLQQALLSLPGGEA